jgi:hypothetical protein
LGERPRAARAWAEERSCAGPRDSSDGLPPRRVIRTACVCSERGDMRSDACAPLRA